MSKEMYLSDQGSVESIPSANFDVQKNPRIQDTPDAKITLDPQEDEKPSYKTQNWISLLYVVVVLFSFFNFIAPLAGIVFWISISTGVIGAANLFTRVVKLAKNKKPAIKIFSFLVGIGGGFVVFVIALIAGLNQYFNIHPIHGD